jgi:hypothetical protein
VTGGDLSIDIMGMTPNREDLSMSTIEARLKNPNLPVNTNDKRETLVVEASVKPFISFVWLGIILMVVGFAIARGRRARDARKLGAYEITDDVHRRPLPQSQQPEPTENVTKEVEL